MRILHACARPSYLYIYRLLILATHCPWNTFHLCYDAVCCTSLATAILPVDFSRALYVYLYFCMYLIHTLNKYNILYSQFRPCAICSAVQRNGILPPPQRRRAVYGDSHSIIIPDYGAVSRRLQHRCGNVVSVVSQGRYLLKNVGRYWSYIK